jgi:hypothetical protein
LPIRIGKLGINVFVLSASVSLPRHIMPKPFVVMSAKLSTIMISREVNEMVISANTI